jgi:CheY-like chemotaxis protein
MKNRALILVVEDDENDALLIGRAFQKSGVTNPRHFSRNGEEAITYLSGLSDYSDTNRNPLPCLVLLDLKMPGISGFDLLHWIRNDPRCKDLRVVVLTSSDEIRDVKEAQRLGANSFLVKPLDFEHVVALFSTLKATL